MVMREFTASSILAAQQATGGLGIYSENGGSRVVEWFPDGRCFVRLPCAIGLQIFLSSYMKVYSYQRRT